MQEIVADYTIIGKIKIDDMEIVLGENKDLLKKYVTWQKPVYRDDYNHGHYFEERAVALRDYFDRIGNFADVREKPIKNRDDYDR